MEREHGQLSIEKPQKTKTLLVQKVDPVNMSHQKATQISKNRWPSDNFTSHLTNFSEGL